MERDSGFDKQAFSRKLRVLRKQHGFSQKEMANCLEIDRSTYASYEIGRSLPSLGSVKAIAELLQVSSDFLLGIHSQREEDAQEP